MQTAMNPQMGRDLNVTDSVLRPLFSNMSVILLLLMPLVTMRLFAEERRSGTIELLLTYPVRDGAVLIGKYLAALALYVVMLAGTLLYPAIAPVLRAARVGTAAHRLPRAAADGRDVPRRRALRLVADREPDRGRHRHLRRPADVLGASAGRRTPPAGRCGAVLTHLSILEHYDSFAKGVLDTKDIIYYLNFTALALFLTLRSLEARRWKG